MQWRRSDFDRFDPQLLPAFLAAAEYGNFTVAAKAMAMTQSGVSQHVRRLETLLGVQLFARDQGGAELTEAGRKLQQFASHYVEIIAAMNADLQGAEELLAGVVSYAMPESCLFADHFATLLVQRKKEFPNVDLKVQIADPELIHEMVAGGEVDFGFVTDRRFSDVYRHDFFCKEEYVLVTPKALPMQELTEESLSKLPFISYRGAADVFYLWRSIHFPRAKELSFQSLNIRGHVDSLFGVMTMLQSGLGATVLAKQCCESLLKGRELNESKSKRAKSTKNSEHDVYIVRKAGHRYPRKVDAIVEAFLKMV